MNRPRLLDLPCGATTQLDHDAMEKVRGYHWYRTANGYVGAMTRDGDRRTMVLIHRILTDAPSGTHVDHINGDKLDNRSENLRVVTPSTNQVNRKKLNRNNTSGQRGVVYRPKASASRPWRAQITVNRRNIYLGLHETREAAVKARREAELLHYGELCP